MSDEQMQGQKELIADMLESCMASPNLATTLEVEAGGVTLAFRVQLLRCSEAPPESVH